MKPKYLFIAWILLLLSSCRQQPEQDKVQFRARIINARTDKVMVSRNFLFIDADTLYIQNENETKGKVCAPEEGLYFIYIYPEFQTVYLKPGDSLALHINIEEFDESLSFSGSLGFENNLLMELYLMNEKESDYFYQSDFRFKPDEFLQKIDSFAADTQQVLDNYRVELKNTTSRFKNIIDLWQKSLEYDLREAYLLKHPEEKLPANYTDYHRVLQSSLPDPNIIYMYALIENHIRRKNPRRGIPTGKWYRNTAGIIKEKVADPSFKDNLMVKYCYRYIKETKAPETDSVISFYFKHIQNQKYINFCQNKIRKNKRLQTGNKFPAMELTDKKGKKFISDSLFGDKKILLSFWELKRRKNFISNLNKLKQIKEKFPGLEIVVLNTDSGSFEEWLLQLPKDTGFRFYQSTRESQNARVSPYHPAQVFLLENDTIKLSMENMYSPDFEDKLTRFSGIKK